MKRKLLLITLLIAAAAVASCQKASAYAFSPNVRIENVRRGTVPGRYTVVMADIRISNSSHREIRMHSWDIVVTDRWGREYPAEFYTAGHWDTVYDPWGRPQYFPRHQPVSTIYILPRATTTIRAMFHLPLRSSPQNLSVRYRGSELRRRAIF